MIFTNDKCLAIIVCICFAILQALQPFIHAHLDADHPIQNTGFHVGSDHEEALDTEHLADHAVFNGAHASHTVSVDSSIKQDSKETFLANAILVVVLSLCFILTLKSTHRLNPAFLLIPKESLKRRLPASRAPPKV
ncbi:MAG: hypothetical protein CTY10_06875 [Methylotenera sp.]|nr:MAG: hypothetical protein CTY10_06875 [Methylotenera sp.]